MVSKRHQLGLIPKLNIDSIRLCKRGRDRYRLPLMAAVILWPTAGPHPALHHDPRLAAGVFAKLSILAKCRVLTMPGSANRWGLTSIVQICYVVRIEFTPIDGFPFDSARH